MAEIQAGITALVTAYARAYHATHDRPIIFDDSLADQYYTAEEHRQFNKNLADALPAIDPDFATTQPDEATALAVVMQTMHEPVTISRSRYTEDCLEEAIKVGVGQYVILGAGLDTFAFRRPDLADRLQVFEVDHPVTQGMKQQRIGMAGWLTPKNLHLVPVDFAKDDLADALRNAAYKPDTLSFISWLGVTYYLTHEAIAETLKALSGLATQGSSLVFDYFDDEAFDPQQAARRTTLMRLTAGRVGEPMKTSFKPEALAAELSGLGFRLEENLAPSDIQACYFSGRTDRLRAFEHIHFARALVE
jgi:methyltransferase (TIGR00027 family)